MLRFLLAGVIVANIGSGCIIPTYAGKSSLNETEFAKSDVKIQKVLILGAGSSPSRLFLENLSTPLIKLFAQYRIQSDFTYIGKIPRRSHVDISQFVSSNYDGYLLLNPVDTSYIDTHKSVAAFGAPLPGGYTASGSIIGNQYREDYYTELYVNGITLNKVWQGELKVDFDLATNERYQTITKQILEKLLKNGYLTKP